MKKFLCTILAILAYATIACAQESSLDEILANYYKAVGFQNLLKTNTIIMTGTMIQQDAMPVKITKVRPDKYLMEFDIQDITAYQAFDGQTAWMTAPWTGNPKPQVMPGDRAKDMKVRADFDGVLYDWKAKGHVVELVGVDTVENTLMHKLKVTKNDGGVEYLFIDPATFLIMKRLYYRQIRGQETAMENYFRDYREVGGVRFAFVQDTQIGGQPYNSLQFEAIELNKKVDPKIFTMPEK